MFTLSLIGIFLLWMLWIGWRAHQTSTSTGAHIEHFLIGNRSVAGILVAIGVSMGWVDANVFSFYTGMAFDKGWGALSIVLGTVLPFLLLAYFAGNIRALGAKSGMYMMSDFIREKFSKRCGAIVGFATFAYFVLWMLVQFFVGGQVIQATTGFAPLTTSLVMGGVVLTYLLLGGFRSQIYTDLAQFGLVAVVLFLLFGRFVGHATTWVAPAITFGSLSALSWISLFVVSGAATIGAADVWQRIYSAKSEKDAKKSMFLSFLIMAVVYSVMCAFGMIIKYYGWATSSNDIAPAIFSHIVPDFLLPFAVVMLFAVIMSTIATTLFGSAMALSNDLLYGSGFIARERIYFWQRIFMVIILVAGIGIASSGINIISVVLSSFAACLVPLPILLAMLYKIELDERSVFWSMLVSACVFVLGVIFAFLNDTYALLPLVAGVGVLVIVEIFIRLRPTYRKMSA